MLQFVLFIIGGIGAIVGAFAEFFPDERRRPAKVIGLIVAVVGLVLGLILLIQAQRSESAKAAESRRTTEEQLLLLRVVATGLRSVEFAAVFEIPTDKPALRDFRDLLFESATGIEPVPFDVGFVRVTGWNGVDPASRTKNTVGFVPPADRDKVMTSSATPLIYLRNIGIRAALFRRISDELPGPTEIPIMELYPSVVIQPEYHFFNEAVTSKTWCRFRFEPKNWRSETALPSIYDFNDAWLAVSVEAADGDRLNIDSEPGITVGRLLDETRVSLARIRLNEAELSLESHFLVEQIDPATKKLTRYYHLPRDFFDPLRGRLSSQQEDR